VSLGKPKRAEAAWVVEQVLGRQVIGGIQAVGRGRRYQRGDLRIERFDAILV